MVLSAGTGDGRSGCDGGDSPAADAAISSEGIPSGAESSNASNSNAAAASIAADLTVLESTLGVGGAATNTNSAGIFYTVPSLVGGRAAYESIGTALGGARARLEAAATGTSGAGTSAGAGGGSDDANRNNNAGTSAGGGDEDAVGPLGAVAARLRVLERAYSSRRGGGLGLGLSMSTSTSAPPARQPPTSTAADASGEHKDGDDASEDVRRKEEDANSRRRSSLGFRSNFAGSRAGSSTLLASRRLASAAGFVTEGINITGDGGFGAAQAGLLASIAERRASLPVSSRSSSDVAVLDEEEGEEGIEGIETILEEVVIGEDVEEESKDDQKLQPRVPPQPIQPVLYSWGSGGTGNLLHEDCSDRSLLPSSASSDDDDKDTDNAADAALKESEVDASTRLGRHTILSISASVHHAAVSTTTGTVVSCGTNAYGVVDPLEYTDDTQIIAKPRSLAECLGSARVVSVSCGNEHTAAVRANGMVMTWGNDGGGRLGHRRGFEKSKGSKEDDDEGGDGNIDESGKRRTPAAMQLPPGRRAAAAACGSEYTLVLTTRREVLGCGAAPTASDLRLTAEAPSFASPVLGGMPISIIAAGDRHAVVVTEFGTAYAWGSNEAGCCGRPFPPTLARPVPMVVPDTSRSRPAHDSTDGGPVNEVPFANWARWEGRRHPPSLADDVRITAAAAGTSFTVLVCASGRLLVCGANDAGQLGVAPCCEQIVPAVPVAHPLELTHKTKFVSVEAGMKHALLLDDAGDVWQTGSSSVGPSSSPSAPLARVICGRGVRLIAAGGNQSYAITSGGSSGLSRQFSLASDSLLSSAHSSPRGPKNESSWASSLLSRFDTLIAKVESEGGTAASLAVLASSTEEILSWPAVLGSLFMDPSALDTFYKKLIYSDKDCQFVRPDIAAAVQRGIDRGLRHLKSSGARFTYPASVRCLLQYLQCPLFSDEAVKHTSDSTGLIFDEGGEVFQRKSSLMVMLVPFSDSCYKYSSLSLSSSYPFFALAHFPF